MIEVRNLTKSYNVLEKPVVKNVSKIFFTLKNFYAILC